MQDVRVALQLDIYNFLIFVQLVKNSTVNAVFVLSVPVLYSYITNGIKNMAYRKFLQETLKYFSASIDIIHGGINALFKQ